MRTAPAAAPGRSGPALPAVVMATALAYASVSAMAALLTLALAGLPGIALPLYPSAGIALAAVLTYGRAALPGVALGAFVFNLGLALALRHSTWQMATVPAIVGTGAALQAALGAVLIRRFVSQPVVLNAPRDIVMFGLCGAGVACLLNPSLATPALWLTGGIDADAAFNTWLTWWVGDTLGVLVGAPLALTLIGRPVADWHSRRRTLGLPLLAALALLALGMAEFGRLDQSRLAASFERDADRMTAEAQDRLSAPLHALQALHGALRGRGVVDEESLRQAGRWWLQQALPLQALGYSARVPADEVSAFEAAARAQGQPGYRIFDRDDGSARAADGEVVALRYIQPPDGNEGALGVNVLSVPAARAAVLGTRDGGEPAATAGFRLTQDASREGSGIVLYQALYRGEPNDVAARRRNFMGVVFVTVRVDRALAGLATPGQQYLSWCLIDADPRAEIRRLAGPAGCDTATPPPGTMHAQRGVYLGGRALELRIATHGPPPGREREAAWLVSLAGVAAAALLGALLLTITGHSRRTEMAVHQGTAELRREMAQRSRAQEALRDSEARLRSILDHVPLGLLFLDTQGEIIECNPRFAEMLGLTPDSVRGRPVIDFVQPGDAEPLRGLRRQLMDGVTETTLDRVHLHAAGGGELIVRVGTCALRDPAGRVQRMVAVVEDITDQLRLEESEQALHRAEAANRAKSEFLSRMSHELRTPLNAMIGFAQLLGLDREPALANHQREWTQQIQRAGWHLLEMINETLDLARIESGAVQLKLVPVALQPLISACHALVSTPAAQRGVRVAHHVDPQATAVLGDATRLKQVLTNLLTNAVKYNHEGGAVTIAARRVRGTEGAADRIEIAVADTGLGMTAEQLGALFQPYNRLGREGSGIEGTGIGLVISRRLTELMGGALEVSSEAGRGSVFTLSLPAADAGGDAPIVRYTDTSPAPYQQRLVHYVEDNETNVEVMRGIFAQRAQIKLEVSMLGLDGLAAIRERRPDLILLDMHLPDISGMELLRHLKQDELVAGIPVVVVSADATTAHMQQALTSGALHYVTKPLDVGNFLKTIDSILEEVETRWGM